MLSISQTIRVVILAVMLFPQCHEKQKLSEPLCLPFRLINDIIYVRIGINEIDSLNFIFDTGAGSTLIGLRTGDLLGLTNGKKSTNIGAAGSHPVQIFHGNSIAIGQETIDNISLIKNETELSSALLGERLDGIVGYDILSRFVVTIDYDRSLIELHDFGKYSADSSWHEIKFKKISNIPSISLAFTIDDKEYLGKFLVDSGADANMILGPSFVKDNGIMEEIHNSYSFNSRIGTSNAKTEVVITRISNMKMGKVDFRQVPLALILSNSGVFSLLNFDGILGNSILKRFNITFDYRKNRMFINPNKSIDEGFSVDCLGILFKKDKSDGKLIVQNTIKGSSAEKAGLIRGDTITSINNMDIKDLSSHELRILFRDDGSDITFEYLRSGQPYVVKMKLKALI
ncbi:MAG: aspartyl protease family protein [Ekhidna sp.]